VHREEHKYVLPEYLQGTLDDARRREVELHLRECPECRRELDELRVVFHELEGQRVSTPAPAYFASLAPRIRMRLEERQPFRWLRHPIISRIALPLATACLALALLMRIPLGHQASDSELTFDAEDVVESLVLNQDPSQIFVTEQTAEAAIRADVLSRQLAAQLVTPGIDPGVHDWIETPTDQLLAELSEDEISLLLQQLEERKIVQ